MSFFVVLAGIGNAFANTNGAAFRSGWVTTGTNKFGTVMVNGLTTAGRVSKTVAHAVVGGMRGKLSGASFSKSFVSAGFTQAAARTIDGIGGVTMGGAASRVVAAGVVGGSAQSLAGGEFRDGFMTGVLSRALNDGLHEGLAQKRNGAVVVDSRPTGRTTSTQAEDQSFDVFRPRLMTAYQDYPGPVYEALDATGRIAASYGRLGFIGVAASVVDSSYSFDHYVETYEMEYIGTEMETTYAIYDDGRFLGLKTKLTVIQSPIPIPTGESTQVEYIGRTRAPYAAPRF